MYVTYGSRFSTPSPELLPPHQRYLSDRVWYVRQLAKDAGEEFGIITAEYGLVFEDQSVPQHEHMPQQDELESLGKEVSKTLKQRGVGSITYFVIPEEWSEGGAAYRYGLVLQLACNLAGIPFTVKPITVPLGERTKGQPTPVRPENIEIGGPYTMQKKANKEYWCMECGKALTPEQNIEHHHKGHHIQLVDKKASYLLRAQDDAGVWKEIRRSSFYPDLEIKAKALARKHPERKVEIVRVEEKLWTQADLETEAGPSAKELALGLGLAMAPMAGNPAPAQAADPASFQVMVPQQFTGMTPALVMVDIAAAHSGHPIADNDTPDKSFFRDEQAMYKALDWLRNTSEHKKVKLLRDRKVPEDDIKKAIERGQTIIEDALSAYQDSIAPASWKDF